MLRLACCALCFVLGFDFVLCWVVLCFFVRRVLHVVRSVVVCCVVLCLMLSCCVVVSSVVRMLRCVSCFVVRCVVLLPFVELCVRHCVDHSCRVLHVV